MAYALNCYAVNIRGERLGPIMMKARFEHEWIARVEASKLEDAWHGVRWYEVIEVEDQQGESP